MWSFQQPQPLQDLLGGGPGVATAHQPARKSPPVSRSSRKGKIRTAKLRRALPSSGKAMTHSCSQAEDQRMQCLVTVLQCGVLQNTQQRHSMHPGL